jgi:CDP-diacylglycerol--serine O-phosphatidyltransferase
LLLPCFAAYRLAKFNIDNRQTTTFLGVPTPAVGLLIASFPLIILYDQPMVSWFYKPWLIYLLILLLGVLMVCNIPFFSLKMKKLSWKNNAIQLIIVILVLISIPFLKWAAVPFAFALYVVFSVGKFWFFPERGGK